MQEEEEEEEKKKKKKKKKKKPLIEICDKKKISAKCKKGIFSKITN